MICFHSKIGWVVIMVTTVAANIQLVSTANNTQLTQSFSEPDSENNIAFDLPDLTATTEVQSGGEFQIEAYKSVHNDRILTHDSHRTVANQAVSELFWVSVGHAAFVRTSPSLTRNNRRPSTAPNANSSSTTTTKLFHLTNSGFYAYVQTLTPAHRRLLASTAQKKYRVNVTEDQIVNLILSRFECSLTLFDDADNKHLINGRVTDFRLFPLRMDFRAPRNSLSRKLFLELLQDTDDEQVDLHFQCQMASRGRMMRTNVLTISQHQMEQIELIDKLFGSASEEQQTAAFVTRNQMNELASEMYTTLNIVEEYEMPEVEFNEAFVSDLIRQLADQHFTMVPFDSVLQTLCKYGFDFQDDLSPDRVKRDLGSLLVIQRVDQKSKVVLNNSKYQELTDLSHSSGGGSGNLGVLDILGFGASAQWARSNNQSSISDVKSLNDQLKELNQLSVNDVMWAIEGERVIPKQLNVARLSRGHLTRGLTFRKVRIQTYNAPFNREFGMYTLRMVQSPLLPSSVDRLNVKVSQLDSLVAQQNLSLRTPLLQLESLVTQQNLGLRTSLLQLNESLSSAWTQIHQKVRRCRVCFEARNGGPDNVNWNTPYYNWQCDGHRSSCSGWSDLPQWSPEFLDNTDDRPGWCWYKWKLECEL